MQLSGKTRYFAPGNLPFCSRADGVAEHPGPGGDAARSDAAVDTVIVVDKVQVTAIKQGPVLRSTAVASSIIGSRAVERSGVSALKEVALTVPNFHAPDYGSRMTSSADWAPASTSRSSE